MGMGQGGPHNSSNSQNVVSSSSHHIGPNLHHYRGLIPPFVSFIIYVLSLTILFNLVHRINFFEYIQMYRGNFSGGFPSQFPANTSSGAPRPRFNYPSERFPPPSVRQQERERVPEEEIITRPIIKEEDLTRMDDISRDAGWAAHDDIDYNQKLAFSDDEPDPEPSKKDERKDNKEEKIEENSTDDKEKTRDSRDNRETHDNRDLKESRDQATHRSWTQNTLSRDYRGSNGSGSYSGQSQLHSVHSLRGQNIYVI